MSGSVRTLFYGDQAECAEVQKLMQSLFCGEPQFMECRHVSCHEDLAEELMRWNPCLTIVLADGPAGMEGVYAVKDNHPRSSVFWFSNDRGFGVMSHRLDCAYFSVKPVTKEKLQRALRRCDHVGIQLS